MDASAIFDAFVSASTFRTIQQTFLQLCLALEVDPSDGSSIYKGLRQLKDWKAEKLWKLLDKRFNQKEYLQQKAGEKLTTLIIGAGPCGLRMAIECALLGNRVIVVEQREKFSRNNVLHLWEFVIHDIKALGAKMFYPKFCTGSIEHISIRQLQCILLKVALCFGVQVHEGITFKEIIIPSEETNTGFRAAFEPSSHILTELEFDILIGADGKRNTVPGFRRDELRGKLAIAITANFINKKTPEEEKVPEISGVAYIFNQSFFKEMYEKTGVDLENIVYYKDETHYFVMCAKKQSLLDMGVLRKDCDDVIALLSSANLDKDALCSYAEKAAMFATKGALPSLDFAENHRGEKDIAAFDFTSLYSAKHSVRLLERRGKRLLMGIVGDSLHEPFWPTGSGCARGFLGVFDTAWLIRDYGINQKGPLEMIAERESVYRLLAQVTKDNMHKMISKYTIDPRTRYMHPDMSLEPDEVVSLVISDNPRSLPVHEPLDLNSNVSAHLMSSDSLIRYSLWRFCTQALSQYRLKIVDLDKSWNDGLALAGLLAKFSQKTFDYFNILSMKDIKQRLQTCFEAAENNFNVLEPCDPQVWEYLRYHRKIDYIKRIVDNIRKDIKLVQRCLLTPRSMKRKVAEKPRPRNTRRATQPIEKLAMDLLESFKGEDSKKLFKPHSTNDFARRPDSDVHRVSLVRNSTTSFENLDAGDILNKTEQPSSSKFQEKVNVNPVKYSTSFNSQVGRTRAISDAKSGDYYKDISAGDTVTKWRLPGKADSNGGLFLRSNEKENGNAEFKNTTPLKRHSVPVMTADSLNVHRQIMCDLCEKVVYLAERVQVENVFIHKNCFRCSFCSQPLRLGEYGKDKELDSTYSKKLFCNVHLRVPLREKISQIERISRRNNRLSATVAPIPSAVVSPLQSGNNSHILSAVVTPIQSTNNLASYTSSNERHHYHATLSTPQQSRESRSIISPISELTNEDDRTPERAEFGSHIRPKSSAPFKLEASESEDEDFNQCAANENKPDSDEEPSFSDCENLEEGDLDVFQKSVLQLDDENPEKPVTDEQLVSIIDRMNRRRRSLLPGTPKTDDSLFDTENMFTSDETNNISSTNSESAAQPDPLATAPLESEFLDCRSPLDENIRKQKAQELANLRLELRKKAQLKTDYELGIGSNLSESKHAIPQHADSSTTYQTPVRENKSTRSNLLLNDMPSLKRDTAPPTVSLESIQPTNLFTPEKNVKNEPITSPPKTSELLIPKFSSDTSSRESVFQSNQLHIESKKETGLLGKPYHRIKQRRETNSPTQSNSMNISEITVATDLRVAAIPPSPRVINENVEEQTTPTHISVDPVTLRQFHKKAEKIKRQRDQGLSQHAQELQLTIERNDVRLLELNSLIQKKAAILEEDPYNQLELISWLELIKERDSLSFVNKGKVLEIQKVKLHVRYRELNRKCFDAEEMAETVTLEEMLKTVRDKEEVDNQLNNYIKESQRSVVRIEDVLRNKKFNFKNFEKDYKLVPAS